MTAYKLTNGLIIEQTLRATDAFAGIADLCQMSATLWADASVAPSGLDCQC